MDIIKEYNSKGFCLISDVFSQDEVNIIKSKVERLTLISSEQQTMESDDSSLRSIHGLHFLDPFFSFLPTLPKLFRPVTQILGGASTYLYQSRVIFKQPFVGDIWPWHQDFIYWKNEDGISRPDLVLCIIYLDDNTEFNSPLFLIESSHKKGIVEVKSKTGASKDKDWKSNLGRDIEFVLGEKELLLLLKDGCLVSAQGKAGSVLFLHPNMVHGSGINLSPYTRTNLFLIFNDINNKPDFTKAHRPGFLSSQEISPLKASKENIISLLRI